MYHTLLHIGVRRLQVTFQMAYSAI
jgi:hypothetical protein